MSADGPRGSETIASKFIQGGFPTNNQVIAFNAANNRWEFVAQGGALWTVLGDYEAAAPEASHNFNFPAITFDDDSMLVLEYDLAPTAVFSLLMRINTNATANYFVDGRRINGGTETLIDLNSQNTIELINTAITSTLVGLAGRVNIYLGKGATTDRPFIDGIGGSSGQQVIRGQLSNDEVSITDIEIRTSTSTWKIGGRATLYRVSRA